MAKSNKLANLIRELVKQEVKKQVTEIFIKEGVKSMTESASKNDVVEVLPKRKSKPKKEVTYTKNPVLNDILNETANAGTDEYEEYPTMTGKSFDSTKWLKAWRYGNMTMVMESREKERKSMSNNYESDTNNEKVQECNQVNKRLQV